MTKGARQIRSRGHSGIGSRRLLSPTFVRGTRVTVKLRLLAWIYIVLTGAGLLVGTFLCVGFVLSGDKESRALEFVGPMFLMAATFYLVPGFAGGIGLLYGKSWARVLLIILSALILLAIPVGTIFGGFALWILLGAEANRVFAGTAQPIPAAAPAVAPALPWPPRYNGLLLCMAAVASGFVVLLGTGSRLTGQPSPEMIPAGLYYGSIVVLIGVTVLGVRWLASQPPPVMPDLDWLNPFHRRRLALLRVRSEQERLSRLAKLAANSGTRKYVALIEHGESWNDAQIAYNEDRDKLATCVHVQPIERAIRASGIQVKSLHGMDVRAKCQIDHVELRRRFALPDTVHYTEGVIDQRSYEDPPSAWIVCVVCRSIIDAVHRHEATPDIPVFPAPTPSS